MLEAAAGANGREEEDDGEGRMPRREDRRGRRGSAGRCVERARVVVVERFGSPVVLAGIGRERHWRQVLGSFWCGVGTWNRMGRRGREKERQPPRWRRKERGRWRRGGDLMEEEEGGMEGGRDGLGGGGERHRGSRGGLDGSSSTRLQRTARGWRAGGRGREGTRETTKAFPAARDADGQAD